VSGGWRRLFAGLALVALFGLLASVYFWTPEGRPGRAAWTVGFVLAGKSDLEREMVKNYQEILDAMHGLPGVHAAVLLDRDQDLAGEPWSWAGARLLAARGPWPEAAFDPLPVRAPRAVDARRFQDQLLPRLEEPDRELVLESYRLLGGKYRLTGQGLAASEDLARILVDAGYYPDVSDPDFDPAGADNLAAFVRWLQETYPADRCALVLAGHGSGWITPAVARAARRSRAAESVDADAASGRGSPGGGQYVPDVPVGPQEAGSLRPGAVGRALAGQGVDVLVLDACRMADMAGLHALAPAAPFLVANQSTVPAWGIDYRDWLGSVSGDEDPEALAVSVVASLSRTFATDVYPLAASAVDTRGLADFARALDDLVAASDPRSIRAAGSRARSVDMRGCDPSLVADAGMVARALSGPGTDLAGLYDSMFAARMAANTRASGAAIFWPASEEAWRALGPAWLKTGFAREYPAWGRFLEWEYGPPDSPDPADPPGRSDSRD
jgi:hypothetical protein